MRRTRRLLENLAMVVLSVVTVFAAGELIVTRMAMSRAARETQSDLSEKYPGLPLLHQADFTRPNADGIYAGKRLRTNSLGFRGAEVTLEKPPGTYRVVIIGDSVTMGHGVSDDETYAARLEAAWNAGSEKRYQVLNLGISSINFRTSLDRLQRFGLSLDPDLVIYGFSHNDLEGIPSYRETDNDDRFEQWATIRSKLWQRLVMGSYYLRDCFYPERSSYIYELQENFFRNPAAWRDFTADLRRLRRLTQERGICLAILLHAAVEDANLLSPFPQFMERVEDAATQMGILVIPTRSLFRQYSEAELRVGIADPHPNALGHELYTEALRAGLARLPKSCGVSATR